MCLTWWAGIFNPGISTQGFSFLLTLSVAPFFQYFSECPREVGKTKCCPLRMLYQRVSSELCWQHCHTAFPVSHNFLTLENALIANVLHCTWLLGMQLWTGISVLTSAQNTDQTARKNKRKSLCSCLGLRTVVCRVTEVPNWHGVRGRKFSGVLACLQGLCHSWTNRLWYLHTC